MQAGCSFCRGESTEFGLRCQGGYFGLDNYGSVEGKTADAMVWSIGFSGLFFLSAAPDGPDGVVVTDSSFLSGPT